MRAGVIVSALMLSASGWAGGAELKPATVAAFESYVRKVEARIGEQVSGKRSFLWVDESPQRREMVRQGGIVAQPWNARGHVDAPDGLIHDWIGAVFIPGTTLEKTLALVRDYDRHASIYQPEVIASKVLARDGDHFRVYLRLLKKKVITVVLNTEHDVNYYPLDGHRCHSRSYSTRMTQVDNPGRPDERELPQGRDHGFLWKLYSYWRFEERDGGVYIECEAVSLTRGIPVGLSLLIDPIIRDLPKESLVRTLEGTRRALRP